MNTMKKSTKSKTQTRPAVRQSTITVRDLVDKFGKATLGASFSADDPKAHLLYPDGYQRHQARVLCDLVNFAGSLSVQEMTNDRASAFVNYLHMVHPQRNGKTPSRLTVLKMANTASAVFNYGVKLGLCRGNPFRGLKDQPSHTIATAMEALRYDHGGVMTVPAVLFSQFLAMAERAQRKARRVAKLAHAKTAHRSSRVRATAKSKAIDLMAAIIREAHAHEARRLASLRARRRSK